MDAPDWLAPHVAADERVAWSQDADRNWAPFGWSVFGVAVSAYFGGSWFLDMPGRWSWAWALVPGKGPTLPQWLVLIVGFVGFVGTLGEQHLKRHFTAWAVTDRRLVRVARLGPERAASWPLAQVRIVEKERKKGRSRVRVQMTSSSGKRLARFRISGVEDEVALLSALGRSPSAP
jgi:hypothetical protein